MSMPKRELDVHKLEAFIKGLRDSIIKLEIARDKKTLSYDKAVIAAKCLEKFFSENGINNGTTFYESICRSLLSLIYPPDLQILSIISSFRIFARIYSRSSL